MLGWVLTFLILALLTALLALAGLPDTVTTVTKALSVFFGAVFVLSLLLCRKRS